MIKIEVADTTVENISGVGRTSGKPYSFNKQTAYAHLPGQKYPIEVEITLDDNQGPYAVGMYVLRPESIYVDRNKRLSLGRVQLGQFPVSNKSVA